MSNCIIPYLGSEDEIPDEELYDMLMNKEFYQYFGADHTLPQDKYASSYLKLNSYQSICKNYMHPKLNNKRLLLMHQPGCHRRGTKIIMFDKTLKSVEDIRRGDKLLPDEGDEPRTVMMLCRGVGQMYQVEYGNGIGHFICNSEHIITIVLSNHIIDIKLSDYLANIDKYKGSKMMRRASIPCGNRLSDLIKDAQTDGHTYIVKKTDEAIKTLNQYNLYYRMSPVIDMIYFNDLMLSELLPFKVREEETCEDYYGFGLDGNGRYVLAQHSIITHNSGKTITALATAQNYVEIYKNIYTSALSKMIPSRDNMHYLDVSTPSIFVFGVSGTIVAFVRDMLKYPEFGYISIKEKAELATLPQQLVREKLSSYKRRIFHKNRGGFFKFYGYQTFVNRLFTSDKIKLTEIETVAKRNNKTVEDLMQEYIDNGDIKLNVELLKRFQDSFIICDEMHHLYNSVSKNNYGVAIHYLLKMVPSARAMFLSATPINNNPAEFCDMVDFLNDFKTPRSDLFNSWKLKPGMENRIKELIRGKISFVQDDNPELFPITTFDGAENTFIPYLKFIDCPMSEYHQKTLNHMLKLRNDSSEKPTEEDDELTEVGESAYSFHKIPISAYAIYDGVIPHGEYGIYTSNDVKLIKDAEDTAYVNLINTKESVLVNGLFMKSKEIAKYSTKMQRLIDDIMSIIKRKKPRGEKIMVYNDRVKNYGVLFVQQLLIQNGFLNDSQDPAENTICASCGTIQSGHTDEHVFTPARFLMAHSNMEKAKMELNRDKFNATSNIYGDEYLILVGSKIIKESFDFRCVRHFIIMNIPTNISSLLQILGRCSRKNSHIELLPQDRTVRIYIYLTTVNMKFDHLAEKSPEELKYEFKMRVYKEIQKIEKPIHENAIDASLIRDVIMPKSVRDTYFPNGTSEVVEQLGELYFEPDMNLSANAKPSTITYNAYSFFKEEVNLMIYMIKRLFVECPIWTYGTLWDRLHKPDFNIEVNSGTFSEDNFIIALYNLCHPQNIKFGESSTDSIQSLLNSVEQIFYIEDQRYHIIQVSNYYIAVIVNAGQMNDIDVETYIRPPHINDVQRVDLGEIVKQRIENSESIKILTMLMAEKTLNFEEILLKIPIHTQKFIIEKCITDFDNSDQQVKTFYKKFLDFYKQFEVVIYIKEVKVYRDIVSLYPFIKELGNAVPIAYMIDKNIRLYNILTNSWVELNKITMNRKIAYKEANVVGYLEGGKKGVVKFKIKTTQTSANIKDKRKLFRGESCETLNKTELTNYMRKLDIHEKTNGIADTCGFLMKKLLDLEIVERQNDTKIKYFYGWWNELPN